MHSRNLKYVEHNYWDDIGDLGIEVDLKSMTTYPEFLEGSITHRE
ncbi:hypothetical protein MASR1M107_33690 [Ignavibacteriales bacterium]